MPGKGLQYVPIRWPDKWDPVFMDNLVKEVLSLADARNVIEGAGIEITGNSDVPATISSSEDIQQLKDQGYVVADTPDAVIPNARILAGEDMVVEIDDGGPGHNITVKITAHGLSYSKLRLGAPLTLVGNPANTSAELTGIAASANDTVARRTSDLLSFGQLTVGMAPDDLWTYAKIQNVSATSRILGRKTTGAGDIEECTLSEILDFIGSAAQGDILYRGASAWARLAAGSAGTFLKTQGASANPVWASPAGSPGGETALNTLIAADTPTAWWKLDETGGTTFADSSGGGFTLTVAGTVALARAPISPGLTAKYMSTATTGNNGASATTKLGLTPPLNGNWTVEAVINTKSGGTQYLFTMGGSGETEAVNFQIEFYLNAGEIRVFWEHSTGTNDDIASGVTLAEGKSYHLAVVKDNSAKTLTFYVNGIEVSVASYTNEPTGGTGTLSTSICYESGTPTNGAPVAQAYVVFYYNIKVTAANILLRAQAIGLVG